MNHNIQDYNNLNIIIGVNLCMENLWPVEPLRAGDVVIFDALFHLVTKAN